MGHINLSERRKARAGAPHEVTLGGLTWELPAELPVMVGEHLARGEFGKAIELLFGEGADDAKAALTLDDLSEIVTVYGVELGERSASSRS